MGSNESGDRSGISGVFLGLIDEVQASGPRATMFIVGIALFIAGLAFPGSRTILIGAGIVALLLLAVDIARGGSIAD